MDGTLNTQRSCVGIILVGPNNIEIAYALRFDFKVINNEVEYEALLASLDLALSFGVDYLEIKDNSQLILKQVNGQIQARGENMQAYLDKVRQLISRIKMVNMEQVPRTKNIRADTLAKLALSLQEKILRKIPIELLSLKNVDQRNIPHSTHIAAN